MQAIEASWDILTYVVVVFFVFFVQESALRSVTTSLHDDQAQQQPRSVTPTILSSTTVWPNFVPLIIIGLVIFNTYMHPIFFLAHQYIDHSTTCIYSVRWNLPRSVFLAAYICILAVNGPVNGCGCLLATISYYSVCGWALIRKSLPCGLIVRFWKSVHAVGSEIAFCKPWWDSWRVR